MINIQGIPAMQNDEQCNSDGSEHTFFVRALSLWFMSNIVHIVCGVPQGSLYNSVTNFLYVAQFKNIISLAKTFILMTHNYLFLPDVIIVATFPMLKWCNSNIREWMIKIY